MRRTGFLLGLLLAAGVPACAQTMTPRLTLIDTATLPAGIDEASGVVESRRHPGIYWVHNDSGDRAWLYATDSTGADHGRVLVLNARNVDWEDIDVGRCPRSAGDCLYIGDIGDNGTNRPKVVIYIVPEPEPPGRGDSATAVPEATIELRYPDHPHDAEALAVRDSTLFLVSKDRFGPATLYRARATGLPSQTLEKVGPLGMEISFLRGRLATGATVSNDGRLLVVRTYVSVHFFDIDHGFQPLSRPAGIGVPVIEAQGEGICFDHLGRLVFVSEGGVRHHGIISRARLEGLGP